MKYLSKMMLMATAVTFIASGAFAEGYRSNTDADRTGSQTFNESGSMGNERLGNADIRDVQQSLNDEGFAVAVDGVMGPQTTSAIRSFQRQNNLSATGNLDSSTMAELDINTSGSSSMNRRSGAASNMNSSGDVGGSVDTDTMNNPDNNVGGSSDIDSSTSMGGSANTSSSSGSM